RVQKELPPDCQRYSPPLAGREQVYNFDDAIPKRNPTAASRLRFLSFGWRDHPALRGERRTAEAWPFAVISVTQIWAQSTGSPAAAALPRRVVVLAFAFVHFEVSLLPIARRT